MTINDLMTILKSTKTLPTLCSRTMMSPDINLDAGWRTLGSRQNGSWRME